jgi:hypothetical protein
VAEAPESTDIAAGVLRCPRNCGHHEDPFEARHAMVWFWTRDKDELEVETRYDNETSEFIVSVVWRNDGRRDTERFKDIEAFRARLVLLERQLEAKNSQNSGPPLLIPEGFPNRRLK